MKNKKLLAMISLLMIMFPSFAFGVMGLTLQLRKISHIKNIRLLFFNSSVLLLVIFTWLASIYFKRSKENVTNKKKKIIFVLFIILIIIIAYFFRMEHYIKSLL